MIYKVSNKKEYKKLKKRVASGVKFLKGKWSNPKFKKEVRHFKAMATAMLEWEIDTGIFEKEFNKWGLGS
jgi:hypothetical protein